MGDSYIKIVPQNVLTEEVNELADKILKFLIDKKIISPDKTDCTLGEPGYCPGDNYNEILLDDNGLLNLITNGLELTIGERTVFWANDIQEIKCPNCNTNIIDLDWGQKIEEWTSNTGDDEIECPNCKKVNSIVDFVFEPAWAFGELGLTFWNWGTFKESFFAELESITGKKMKIIFGKL